MGLYLCTVLLGHSSFLRGGGIIVYLIERHLALKSESTYCTLSSTKMIQILVGNTLESVRNSSQLIFRLEDGKLVLSPSLLSKFRLLQRLSPISPKS